MRRLLSRRGACVLLLHLGLASGHYDSTCLGDEILGEVQGETGSVCSPRCRDVTYDCPVDVPDGVTAQPQCMLQDVDQVAYCGLLCQVDSQCPSGASCRTVTASSTRVGVCIHPLSFADWAKPNTRRKLGIAFPNKAGQPSQSFQIAKAYSALQSLKRRYGIGDSDADVLTVKELLSAIQLPNGAGSSGGSIASSANNALAELQSELRQAEQKAANAISGTGPGGGGGERSVEGAWGHDWYLFKKNMVDGGVSGLEREAGSVVWNVENIERRDAASGLLRGALELGIVYLIVGCVYKSQVLGAKGIEMIPHIGFWMEYPQLVTDGIQYTLQLAAGMFGGQVPGGGMLGAGSGRSGFEPIGKRGTDRDTFGNFEPN